MSGRFDEGYAKGVHDVDAALILQTLMQMHESVGLLRHAPTVRAASLLWFHRLLDAKSRKAMTDWIGGIRKTRSGVPAREARRGVPRATLRSC